MKEVIYLVCTPQKVDRMTKKLPTAYRGETIVKVEVEMPKEAFEPPTLSQKIYVSGWRDELATEDVEFRSDFITKEEAQMIRDRRFETMKEILMRQGYQIIKEEEVTE